jgi:EF hand domain-containing protein
MHKTIAMKPSPLRALLLFNCGFLLVTLTAASAADSKDDPGASSRYEEADTNRDGRISREEFLSGVKNKKDWWPSGQATANTGQNSATPGMFEALDRNKDGFLSKEELENGRRLREVRGDNGPGQSGTRSNRQKSSADGGGNKERKDPDPTPKR